MHYHWYPDASSFAEEWGLSYTDVEDVADHPTTISVNALSVSKGYPVEDRRRGDVTVVVGLREEQPSILYVRVHLPIHTTSGLGSQQPSGSGSELPRTMRGLRSKIVAEGYRIESGGKHDKVLTPDGDFLCSISVTPSEYRSIANNWLAFRRAADKHAVKSRALRGSLYLEETAP